MITLHKLLPSDPAEIHNWPSYPAEFAELDYALRHGGWLAEFQDRTDTWIYVAKQADEIIAFSLLALTGVGEAEFRIALRADKIGHGIGKIFCSMTLHEGFSTLGLSRISLIVRKNNARAILLYRDIGFSLSGARVKIANGKSVEFLEMIILHAA